MSRLVMGMVTAFAGSIAASFLSSFIIGFMISDQPSAQGSYDVGFALFFASLTAWSSSVISAPAILILSVPLHRLAIRLGRASGRDYAIVGAFVGVGVCLVVQIPGQMAIPALFIAPLMGAAAALGFWTVTRPDKAVPGRGG